LRIAYKPHETTRTMTKKELQERNAAFNALSPMKKRVAVAKDVLLQIEIGKFKPGYGYGSLAGPRGGSINPKSSDNLQLIIEKNGVSCVGCAKAAAVVARARLGNCVLGRVGEAVDGVTDEIFGSRLAGILEEMYEGWTIWTDVTKSERKALERYRDSLHDGSLGSTYIMKAIYQNIVTNRGWFVVGKYKY